MNTQVEIDETDVKILRNLIRDSRMKLKDIAKECGLSSTAIFNRIERLKTAGVITGAALLINMSQIGYMFPASIGVDLKPDEQERFLEILRKQSNLLIASESAGSNTFQMFFVAKSMKDIEDLKQFLKKYLGSRKITVSLWTTAHFDFENVELLPTRG